jgi:hypothetical protein
LEVTVPDRGCDGERDALVTRLALLLGDQLVDAGATVATGYVLNLQRAAGSLLNLLEASGWGDIKAATEALDFRVELQADALHRLGHDRDGEIMPLARHRAVVAQLQALRARDEVEAGRIRQAYDVLSHEVEQTLGKALHYPAYGPDWFDDGQPDGSVCVGDHVPESLACEAAETIERLRGLLSQACDEIDDQRDTPSEVAAALRQQGGIATHG